MLIFDCETGPLPREQLEAICPEFSPETVACGNLKDPDKIAAKCAEAKQRWFDDAALSAATGRVLAIGYLSPEKDKLALDHGRDEADLLASFWKQFVKIRNEGRKLIGVNILSFDVPFLVRRSWILNVDIPSTVREGRYFDKSLVDLRDVWLCGQMQQSCESSLNHMSLALGVGSKPAGINGGDFARLYFGSEVEKQQALDYLTNDLQLTAKVARRIGVI
jgi:hypothetical protein